MSESSPSEEESVFDGAKVLKQLPGMRRHGFSSREGRTYRASWEGISGLPSSWIGFANSVPSIIHRLDRGYIHLARRHPDYDDPTLFEAARFGYGIGSARFTGRIVLSNLEIRSFADLRVHDGEAEVLDFKKGHYRPNPDDVEWFNRELEQGASGRTAISPAESPMPQALDAVNFNDWIHWFGVRIQEGSGFDLDARHHQPGQLDD